MPVNICFNSCELMSGLSSLYAKQEMTDLRLVCSDGSLMAHKTVLAAVSDKLLKMMATDNTCNSVILFADYTKEDIKTIIDCIYFGRQTIESNRFKQLSRIAHNFGIKLKSAVSEALSSGHISTPIPPKSSADLIPVSKTSIILCDKKQLKPKPLESIRLVYEDHPYGHDHHQTQFTAQSTLSEIPMDLTVTAEEKSVEDNVRNVIDSIAKFGPQSPSIRRRKQSEPKPIHSKIVRFEENGEPFVRDAVIDQQLAQMETDINQLSHFANNFGDGSLQSALDSGAQNQSIGQKDGHNKNEVNTENKCEVTVVTNTLQNSAIKIKSLVKSPKSATVSEDQLKDCCVCGKAHPTHKQLILHLNKEHKTNEGFKCSVCGKEQKYAKTFAVHSLQCRPIKV